VPALLPLAVGAVEALLRRPRAEPGEDRATPRALEPVAGVLALLVVAALLLGLDRYRRADLRGARDGPLVLAFCRETLRAAARVERGEAVELDPGRMRYVWGVSPPEEMARMRWFLRDGWGDLPHYGTGDAVVRGTEATLVVPCLSPRALALVVGLESPRAVPVAFSLNGRPLRQALVGPGPTAVALDVPAEALFRGDNRLALAGADVADALVLRGLSWRRAP
jgi:hypothetical protein